MSLESTVTGGFGWKHALAIIGLGIVAASAYRNNILGLGAIADKITGTVKNVAG
jgi:hypothetical protein